MTPELDRRGTPLLVRRAGGQRAPSAGAVPAVKARVRDLLVRKARSVLAEVDAGTRSALLQRQILLGYRQLLASGAPLPSFFEAGFGVYSAGEEDGIVLMLMAVAGAGTRCCADIGAGGPYGSNTTNLVVNWGWRALLIEGDERQADQSRRFYAHHPAVEPGRVTSVTDWLTVENVNRLFAEHGLSGEIDLLSIDLDGIDYWIWEALDVVRPRLVIVEVQDIWGSERAVTVPYHRDFSEGPATGFNYCGASLAAWVKLNRRKGYRLVGATSQGLNAFFLRDDVAPEHFPEVSAAACLDQPWLEAGRERRRQQARQRPWVEV